MMRHPSDDENRVQGCILRRRRRAVFTARDPYTEHPVAASSLGAQCGSGPAGLPRACWTFAYDDNRELIESTGHRGLRHADNGESCNSCWRHRKRCTRTHGESLNSIRRAVA